MPLYDYTCTHGHRTEKLRKYVDRDAPADCAECGRRLKRVPSIPHCVPDGMYSYAPNLGDPDKFERRREAQRNHQRVIEVDSP